MAGIGIKGDGNGGYNVKKPALVTALAVAGALGWSGGDLLMGPAKVREDEQLKATVAHLAKEFDRHEVEAEARFNAVERRAEKAADKIDERLAEFEKRLSAFLMELSVSKRGG